MTTERAIEVGNIFKLGERYSEAFGATYLDAEGQSHPILMGSYGIGSGRVTATVVEQRHDDKGICWPASLAPYHVSLVSIYTADDDAPARAADRLYDELTAAGIEVLYDDRAERAGVKFNDADLIGCPIRLSVSARTLARGEAEVKGRTQSEATFVPLADALPTVQRMLAEALAPLSGDGPTPRPGE
jgi:prolyl-tRNA synthetase